jgi:hypothetical protein
MIARLLARARHFWWWRLRPYRYRLRDAQWITGEQDPALIAQRLEQMAGEWGPG